MDEVYESVRIGAEERSWMEGWRRCEYVIEGVAGRRERGGMGHVLERLVGRGFGCVCRVLGVRWYGVCKVMYGFMYV